MKINFEGREVKLNARKDIVVYALWVRDYVLIGSGKAERLQGNPSKLRRNKHDTPQLQEAYNRIKDVRVELLAICNSDIEAREIEQDYINHFKMIDDVIVCNIRPAKNGPTSSAYNKYKRLTREDVIEIKKLLEEYSNKQLADMFNCSTNTISKIRTGARWNYVVVEGSIC